MNAIEIELFNHRFSAICEEMGVTLQRTSISPNIKERLDFSCGLFDGSGAMVAQAAHIPVHLGSMPMSVTAALEELTLRPGDVAALNDPYRGGTHLPDLTLIAPYFTAENDREPDFYVAARAHHADIGGCAPGSMSPSRELYQEGLVIPPIRLIRQGEPDREIFNLILANLRAPAERSGDLKAQVAAIRIGLRRIDQLASAHPREALLHAARALADYSERLLRSALLDLPDGRFSFQDELDDDGDGGPAPIIRATITLRGDRAEIDFAGSSSQVPGNLNAVRAVTASAVFYVFRCLAPPRTPSNAGISRPLALLTPPGSIVDARAPAGVAGGNVETSQRIVDVLLGALAQAEPGRIPAASAGSMSNLAFGGVRSSGEPFSYYETVAGGAGAGPECDGLDGVHTHMTNTMNTPVEALEHSLPVEVERYALRRRSGGEGLHRGGQGILRRLRFLAPSTVSLLAERHRSQPYGLAGGHPGRSGAAFLIHNGRRRRLAGKTLEQVDRGDAIELQTPGGGGWGSPTES